MAFLYTDYSRIEREVCEMFGLVYADATDVFLKQVRQHVSRRLEEKWEDVFGEGTMRTEERTYRAEYASGTAYTAGDEVYFVPSGKYYQAVKSTTGNAPATGNPLTVNAAYWAESKTSYSGDEYAAATTYAAGDIVYYQTTDRYYQCHSASTGNAPTDTSYWGVLTALDKYIAWEQTGETAIGLVRGAFNKNPRIHKNWRRYRFTRNENGIQIPEGPNVVWLDFQLRAPELFGDDYSETATYTADVDQVLFTETSGAKNFYNCIVNTSAGEDPEDTAASWSKVNIPHYFKTWLVNAAAGDCYRMDRQEAAAETCLLLAERAWDRELGKVTGLQGITPDFEIVN